MSRLLLLLALVSVAFATPCTDTDIVEVCQSIKEEMCYGGLQVCIDSEGGDTEEEMKDCLNAVEEIYQETILEAIGEVGCSCPEPMCIDADEMVDSDDPKLQSISIQDFF